MSDEEYNLAQLAAIKQYGFLELIAENLLRIDTMNQGYAGSPYWFMVNEEKKEEYLIKAHETLDQWKLIQQDIVNQRISRTSND